MGVAVVGDRACKDEVPGLKRLRREDHLHVKHDNVFCNWAVLIGPSDWEDHYLGKEGTERYRIHNLPLSCSSPGLYELGIAAPRSVSSHKARKLKKRDIVVAYLGQADNVRTRLQDYGRDGSHLEGNPSIFLRQKWDVSFNQQFKSSNDEYILQGPGLFTEIFSRGFFIVFRWASMSTKVQAERTEAQLLKVFDYAWNRGGNGARRPHDVLLKLEKISSQKIFLWESAVRRFSEKKRILFGKKEVGIITDGKKPTQEERPSQGNSTLRIDFGGFSFTRNRFHLVSMKEKMENATSNVSEKVCGIALGDGSFCKVSPVKNRKRCAQHKGRKNTDVKNYIQVSSFSTETVSSHQKDEEPKNENRCCGIPLEDGSVCKILPDKGRKRCNIHKGMRVPVRAM